MNRNSWCTNLMFVEPPPSYESLYGRVKAAQLEAGSKPQFVKKVMIIVMGTRKNMFTCHSFLSFFFIFFFFFGISIKDILSMKSTYLCNNKSTSIINGEKNCNRSLKIKPLCSCCDWHFLNDVLRARVLNTLVATHWDLT